MSIPYPHVDHFHHIPFQQNSTSNHNGQNKFKSCHFGHTQQTKMTTVRQNKQKGMKWRKLIMDIVMSHFNDSQYDNLST